MNVSAKDQSPRMPPEFEFGALSLAVTATVEEWKKTLPETAWPEWTVRVYTKMSLFGLQ